MLESEPDPVVREVHGLGTAVQRLVYATIALYLILATGFATALYLRSNDLEDLVLRDRRASHENDVKSCRAVNEVNRKIYVTLADFGIPQGDPRREKFLPTTNCERLP